MGPKDPASRLSRKITQGFHLQNPILFSIAKRNLVTASSSSSWMVDRMTWHQGNFWGAFIFLCFPSEFCFSLDMVEWTASGINTLVEQVTYVKISWKWPLAVLFKVCLCKIGWHSDKFNLTSPNLRQIDAGIALKIMREYISNQTCPLLSSWSLISVPPKTAHLPHIANILEYENIVVRIFLSAPPKLHRCLRLQKFTGVARNWGWTRGRGQCATLRSTVTSPSYDSKQFIYVRIYL